ncbi:MAG: hypothetical protein DVB31_08605 [Verrucomicrobia bacterium]|nr:MAG: hypothetical protein DVB31_08605 [Verrucomicrobiota bacterium]
MNTSFARTARLSAGVVLALQCRLAAQVPNGGFENWTDCQPDDWASSNVCGLMAPVTKSPAADTGAFAARGEVVSFFGQPIQPLLQIGTTGEGVPISQRYLTLRGSYKFSPVGGDRFAVNVALIKAGSVVAQGAFANPAAAGTYTPFSLTLNYVSPDVPDTAEIQIQIVGPVTGPDFHLGSVMFVDSLEFATGGGAQPPNLSIQRVGGSIVVSWPPDVTGYVLQSTPSLNPTAWNTVSGVANNSHVAVPSTTAYFRLIKG